MVFVSVAITDGDVGWVIPLGELEQSSRWRSLKIYQTKRLADCAMAIAVRPQAFPLFAAYRCRDCGAGAGWRMSLRRGASSVELSVQAAWGGARGLVGFLLAYQLLLQHLPQARDLDVGAFFGPARIRDAGRGAGVDTLGDVHAGGGAVVGVPGSAAAHLGPLAPVVADAVPADATVARLLRA